MHRDDLDGFLTFFYDDLLTKLEVMMFGISAVPKWTRPPEESPFEASFGNVAEELKLFGRECKFLKHSDCVPYLTP